jgi:LuxR family transcriptional regulator, maltose regulon positive regulatory protein
MATEVLATRRRIIRRPRLTTMLDESSARIRLLIAPAGYGKTTLAREWLSEPERNDVWYRGGPASADVAAVAAGISEAIGLIIPDAGKRMRERLRATGHPEEDVDILAELFAEDVQTWPADAWLAIDDYQFAMESVASERFVDLLTQTTPIQMLINSRRRPGWATARRILYGEIQEIDRRALAMEDEEARAVLGREDPAITELIARARGWVAVLGLAALTRDFVLPSEDLPATLHNYFAEEVFQATDPEARIDLALLANAPVVSVELANALLGAKRGAEILEIGLRLGVLTEQSPGTFVMHPLLRDFLQHGIEDADLTDQARQIADHFLAHGEWDHAFDVACRASLGPTLARTIEEGLDPMLSEGRLATVQRWIDFALAEHLDSPVVDLAEAELAFRQGEHERAYVLASQAALRLATSALGARAHVRAGHSALFASREKEGLEHFRCALSMARSWEERREALVGLYYAASELDSPDASETFEQLEASGDITPDGIVRLEVIRLLRATRTGGISAAIEGAMPKLHLIERATDPLGVTSFLHMLATAANIGARYREALELVERERLVASRYRLELPVVHAFLNEAISHIGLRNYRRSTDSLAEVFGHIPASGDYYLEGTVRAIQSRLLLSQQRFADAIALTDDVGETISSLPLRAEYLASRALALACAGQFDDADTSIEAARNTFPTSIEVDVLDASIRTINAIRQGDDDTTRQLARRTWEAAERTGNFDSFVCSYRAEPRILLSVLSNLDLRLEVSQLLSRVPDEALGRKFGLSSTRVRPTKTQVLTPREVEVLDELERGSSNRQIARRLFISESTVKVHLRHIYEKFGVRTRTELLARATKRP